MTAAELRKKIDAELNSEEFDDITKLLRAFWVGVKSRHFDSVASDEIVAFTGFLSGQINANVGCLNSEESIVWGMENRKKQKESRKANV
jgi:hypothetical protein